jgi:hypothetical protein
VFRSEDLPAQTNPPLLDGYMARERQSHRKSAGASTESASRVAIINLAVQ